MDDDLQDYRGLSTLIMDFLCILDELGGQDSLPYAILLRNCVDYHGNSNGDNGVCEQRASVDVPS